MWDPVCPFNTGWGLQPSNLCTDPVAQPLDANNGSTVLRRSSSGRRKLLALETKLQQHMDCEDLRVKELTEAILYEFLPSALNALLPQCDDPIQELDPERCRAVAGAALAVSALMNAPPGFLEFLLCIPWKHLSQLHLRCDGAACLASMDHLKVAEEERVKLVNARISPALMGAVLDFIFRAEHVESLPPMLRPTHMNSAVHPPSACGGGTVTPCPGPTCCAHHAAEAGKQPGKNITPDTVAALLDGATPLHCAALRGNPAQVDHLLFCGSDPLVRTAAGELPMELVPMCGDRHPLSGQRTCRCMATKDQEVWECRSRLARGLIMRKSLLNMSAGLLAWLNMLVLCILCCLGLWGYHVVVLRPRIDQHKLKRAEAKRSEESSKQARLVAELRSTIQQGQLHLEAAKQDTPLLELLPHSKVYGVGEEGFPSTVVQSAGTLRQNAAESGQLFNMDNLLPEKAFRCYVRAVHAVQSLEAAAQEDDSKTPDITLPLLPPSEMKPSIQEDEQAVVYCGWAESVLLKFWACACAGCAALTVQAIRMAHIQCARLFARVDKRKHDCLGVWKTVGQCLAKTVHTHICLLLETEAVASPTRAAVWRAQHCLKEWERLREAGLTLDLGLELQGQVDLLRRWARTAESDLLLAEALLGASLTPPQSVQEGVAAALMYNADGTPFLARAGQLEISKALHEALRSASCPSGALRDLASIVAANVQKELDVAAQLQELVLAKGAVAPSTRAAAGEVMQVIIAAAEFPHLSAEVEAARALMQRWQKRAEAAEQLEAVMEQVRLQSLKCLDIPAFKAALELNAASRASVPVTSSLPSQPASSIPPVALPTSASPIYAAATVSEGAFNATMWEDCMKQLEGAIDEAKDVNISVTKAKRLLKEMQAHAAAVEAVKHLEAVVGKKPCGSAVLKGAVAKAENAATQLAGLGLVGLSSSLQELLLPRVQAAKRRLEGEKAAEALARVTTSCRSVVDLQKLEGAILGARKVGAEELDVECYRAASELRARLAEAAKVKSLLDSAIKALQRQGRGEDAELVQKVLTEAARWEDLLGGETAKAGESLDAWKAHNASEAKLARVLRDGAGTAVLGRAIQEAAAAGVKVQAARRILKLMQALESAMSAAQEQPSTHTTLKARVEAAEAGGVASTLMDDARRLLRKLQMGEAREALEAALKPHSDWSVMQRSAALKNALEAAEEVLVDAWPTDKLGIVEEVAAVANMAPAAGAGLKLAGRMGVSGTPSVSDAGCEGDFEGCSEAGEPIAPQPTSEDSSHRPPESCPFPLDSMDPSDSPPSPHATSVPQSAPPWPHRSLLHLDDAASEAESTTSSIPTSSAQSFTTPRSRVGISRVNLAVLLANKDLLEDDMAILVDLSSRAQKLLEEEHREIERLEREKFELERARREQLEKEKTERERLRAEREREKAERDKTDSQKARKLAAERAEQQKMLLQQVQVLPASEQHRLARERMPRRRKEVKPVTPAPTPPTKSNSSSATATAATQEDVGSVSTEPPMTSTGPLSPSPTTPRLSQPWAQAAKAGVAKAAQQASASPEVNPASPAPMSPPPDPYSPHRPLNKSEVEAAVRRTQHVRADSMEGLTEAALNLNREMLELLEIDAKDPQTSKSFQISPTPTRQRPLSFSPFASPALMASVLPQGSIPIAQSAAVAAGFTSSTSTVPNDFAAGTRSSSNSFPYNTDLSRVFPSMTNSTLVQAVSALDSHNSSTVHPGTFSSATVLGAGTGLGPNVLQEMFSADAATRTVRKSYSDTKGLLSAQNLLFDEASGLNKSLGSHSVSGVNNPLTAMNNRMTGITHAFKSTRRLDLTSSAWSMELPKTSGSFTTAATGSLQLPSTESTNIWGPPTSTQPSSSALPERIFSTTPTPLDQILTSSATSLNQLWSSAGLSVSAALSSTMPVSDATNTSTCTLPASLSLTTSSATSALPTSLSLTTSTTSFHPPASTPTPSLLLNDPVWSLAPPSSATFPTSPQTWPRDLTIPQLPETFSPDTQTHSKPPSSLAFISQSLDQPQLSGALSLTDGATSSLSHTAAALVDWPLTLRQGQGMVALTSRQVPRICRYFLQGYCRDGDMCRFVHPSNSLGVGMGLSGMQAPSMGLSSTGPSGTHQHINHEKAGQLAAMLMAMKAQQQHSHLQAASVANACNNNYTYQPASSNPAYYPTDDSISSDSRVLEASHMHKVNGPPLRINPAHLVSIPSSLLSPSHKLSPNLSLASAMHQSTQLQQHLGFLSPTHSAPSPISHSSFTTIPFHGGPNNMLNMDAASGLGKQGDSTLTSTSSLSFHDMVRSAQAGQQTLQQRIQPPGMISLTSLGRDSQLSSMDSLMSPSGGIMSPSGQAPSRHGCLLAASTATGLENRGGLGPVQRGFSGGTGAFISEAPFPGMDPNYHTYVSLGGAKSGLNNASSNLFTQESAIPGSQVPGVSSSALQNVNLGSWVGRPAPPSPANVAAADTSEAASASEGGCAGAATGAGTGGNGGATTPQPTNVPADAAANATQNAVIAADSQFNSTLQSNTLADCVTTQGVANSANHSSTTPDCFTMPHTALSSTVDSAAVSGVPAVARKLPDQLLELQLPDQLLELGPIEPIVRVGFDQYGNAVGSDIGQVNNLEVARAGEAGGQKEETTRTTAGTLSRGTSLRPDAPVFNVTMTNVN